MSSQEQNYKNAETIVVGFLILIVIAVVIYYFRYDVVVEIWRFIRVVELMMLNVIETIITFPINLIMRIFGYDELIKSYGFADGVNILITAGQGNLDQDFLNRFDRYFSSILKWPFGFLLIYSGIKEFYIRKGPKEVYNLEVIIRKAAKSYPHLKKVVPPNVTEKILAHTIGWVLPSLRERLKGENPINFSDAFDFNNRDDYHNRYALGVRPSEILLANPPLGVTEHEISEDKKMMEETGFSSNFRPICYFFIHDNHDDNSFDFCHRTATLSLERLFIKPLPNIITQEKFLARVYDKNGDLIPLVIKNKKGNLVNKFKAGCEIHDGFRVSRLINNGIQFKGKKEETINLFNEYEKKVLLQLKEKIDGKTDHDFEDILYKIVTEKHAYSVTAIWRLMMLFKEKTRIAGNEFNWLFEVDRTLALAMNSIGRETPFIEVSGIKAHYDIEFNANVKVNTPMVIKAVESLYENAERLMNAGKVEENLMDMDDSDFSKSFSHLKSKKDNSSKEVFKDVDELDNVYGRDDG